MGNRIALVAAAMIMAVACAGCARNASHSIVLSPTAVTAATRRPVQPARIVCRGDAQRRMVALTFDVGSDGAVGEVPQILATLRREDLRASFAVTGLWAEQNHALILAITSAGHQVINATYDGASFTGASTGARPLTAAQRTLELQRTETTVYHLTGRTTRPYVRPPYGDIDAGAPLDVAAAGYGTIVLSTVDTRPWQSLPASDVARRALSAAAPGAIFELHTVAGSPDAAALGQLIDGLRTAGYDFGSVADVIAR